MAYEDPQDRLSCAFRYQICQELQMGGQTRKLRLDIRVNLHYLSNEVKAGVREMTSRGHSLRLDERKLRD